MKDPLNDCSIAIEIKDVYKTFKLPHERQGSVKSTLINFRRRKKGYEKQQVLHGINFEVKKGEFFGIVGRNGSGKSTLLKLLAGIYTPDKGNITINGKLTPFIELGVGFNAELTGRENVYLNGALLGFNRKQVYAMYSKIVKFAELERFMDQKLKNYSSGMQVRLAFSIAIQAKSEILLLDEVLAVGDAAFQAKCYDYFTELKKNKRTVILVTHDMGAVRQYCDRAIMIEKGNVIQSGRAETIAQAYQKLFSDEITESKNASQPGVLTKISTDSKAKQPGSHWGNGKIAAKRPVIKVGNEHVTISAHFEALASLPAPIFGFTIYGPKGENILEGNTKRMSYSTTALSPGEKINLNWRVNNIFSSGTYSVSIACCDQTATEFYDWFNEAGNFTIMKDGQTAGVIDPPLEIISSEEVA